MNKEIVLDHLKNAGLAFAASFLMILGTSLSSMGTVQWSWSLVLSLVTSAVFAALKEVLERSSKNPTLGGRRK